MTAYHDEINRWRVARDEFFREHYASPLSNEAMAQFGGLAYFDIDDSLAFTVTLEPATEEAIPIDSSTGGVSNYRIAGIVTVPFPEGPVSLLALRGEDEDYIPFRDATCGDGSYVGGRYVSLDPRPDGSLRVDFNRTINPYCAYDPDFSCPLPPRQNRLERRIAAGEKDFATT